MKSCPYCSNRLIRCIQHWHSPERSHETRIYWFCRHCWQKVPESYLEWPHHALPDCDVTPQTLAQIKVVPVSR